MAVFVGGPLNRQQQRLAPQVVQSGRYEVLERPPLPDPGAPVGEVTAADVTEITVHIYTQRFLCGQEVWVHREITDDAALKRLLTKAVIAHALNLFVRGD